MVDVDWDQPEEVVEALLEKYLNVNPLDLSFPKLLDMIIGLEGFTGKAEGNLEGKMERIIEVWWEEYQYRKTGK